MNFDVNFVTAIVVKMIVAFLVSQGSVATYLMCGGMHIIGSSRHRIKSPVRIRRQI